MEQVTRIHSRQGGLSTEENILQKIFNADLLDIFPTDHGFVYACKELIDYDQEAIGFFNYDMHADLFERIPVKAYVEYKYGEGGIHLAKSLGDFVTCSLRPITAGENIAAFKNGTLKIFNNNGIILEERKVTYLNNPAVSPEPVGRDLWMTVPEANAVINYSVKYDRIEFRIGGPNEKAFSHPISLSVYDNCLYVCNSNSFKIRTLSLTDYKINDFYIFHEPVYKYFRVKDTEYAVLESGVYSL